MSRGIYASIAHGADKLSRIYEEPDVTAAVKRLAAAQQAKPAA